MENQIKFYDHLKMPLGAVLEEDYKKETVFPFIESSMEKLSKEHNLNLIIKDVKIHQVDDDFENNLETLTIILTEWKQD